MCFGCTKEPSHIFRSRKQKLLITGADPGFLERGFKVTRGGGGSIFLKILHTNELIEIIICLIKKIN